MNLGCDCDEGGPPSASEEEEGGEEREDGEGVDYGVRRDEESESRSRILIKEWKIIRYIHNMRRLRFESYFREDE